MKKFILLCLILTGLNLMAQERPQRRSEMSSEEMATLGAKRMAMQLELNADQEAKLQKIYQDRFEEEKELRADRRDKMEEDREKIKEEMAERKEERTKLTAEYNEKIKEILTAEQYDKYLDLQKKREEGRERMKQRRRPKN